MTRGKPSLSDLDAALKTASINFVRAQQALDEDLRTNRGYDSESIARRKDCEKRLRSAEHALDEARRARQEYSPD
jgi:hypothetical protein